MVTTPGDDSTEEGLNAKIIKLIVRENEIGYWMATVEDLLLGAINLFAEGLRSRLLVAGSSAKWGDLLTFFTDLPPLCWNSINLDTPGRIETLWIIQARMRRYASNSGIQCPHHH